MDIPENVLGQLGLKVHHALRAFTPKDQKTIRAVAQSFVSNSAFDTAEKITTLGIGEALVSVLSVQGVPQPVQQTLIAPPEGRIGPVSETARQDIMQKSPLRGRYDQALDRLSAFEMLKERTQAARAQRAAEDQRRQAQHSRQKHTGGR